MAKTSGGIRGGKLNQDAIDKARSILKRFDFYWRMTDFGYESAMARAESQMREFVRYSNMVGSKKVTRQLRKEWMERFNKSTKR